MKLAEIDHKQVITLAPSDSVSRAFTLMVEHDIRHLPIVEDERVVGIVSDRDLLIIVSWIGAWKSLMHESTVVGKKRVAELMSSPVTVLSREDKIESAARLMLDKRFSAIPIEEQGRLINIVTETDVLRCCVGESSISASRVAGVESVRVYVAGRSHRVSVRSCDAIFSFDERETDSAPSDR